jgi:Pyridoxamine 5'-phosphate oxidase
MSGNEQPQVPEQVLEILKTSQIGYLAVTSPKGDLYSYPVAFYFSGFKVYFMTPISAAKLRFIRANPTVSFLVDNHLLTKGAAGAMLQGKAKVFSIAKTILSVLSVGPKMAKFAQKYPGMFTFYASGKELPDERKLYKYRLIRIEPVKLVYWTGYKFGRYAPPQESRDPLASSSEDEKMETLASLMGKADDELPVEELLQNLEWERSVQAAASEGALTSDERAVIGSYRSMVKRMADSARVGPEVTGDERKLLRRWKDSTK